METRNTTAASYHAKVASTQNQGVHFSWVMEFSITSSCLGKVKAFPIIIVSQS